MKEGRFISFEGLDGAGKTTQIEMLEKWLKSHDIPYIRTREPGGTPLGAEIRRLLLNHPELSNTITPLAQAFLFQADRAQHFADVVLPALRDGNLVITDRCFDASIAYQGYAQGIDVKFVKSLSLAAMQERVPDLTILLDLDPSEVHKRVGYVEQLQLPMLTVETHDQNDVREERNRIDMETQKFHQRVRDGFRALAKSKANRNRIKKVDATGSPQEIHQKIIAYVEPLLGDRLEPKRATTHISSSRGKKSRVKPGKADYQLKLEDTAEIIL